MKKIRIICPACSKSGFILQDEKLIRSNPNGVTAINIQPKQICSHGLVVYVDSELSVRDCFAVDFQLEIPQMESEKIGVDNILDEKMINTDLIKLNFPAIILTYIIRACLLKKKIILLTDNRAIKSNLLNFLDFIFKKSFKIDVSIEDTEVYRKNKKSNKNIIVIDENKVYNDKKRVLNPKKIKIERIIIQKFFAEYVAKSSLIILRNEVRKAFVLAEKLSQMIKLNNQNGKGTDTNIDYKELTHSLETTYNIKLSLPYLFFLIEIIENYFNVNVPQLWKFFLCRLSI